MNYKPLIPYYQAQWMLAGKRSGSGSGPPPNGLLNNLIAYWTLDEASGTRNDSVGTTSLSQSGAPLGAAGKINNGCQFVAASSQYLTHADSVLLRVTSDFTWSLWVKINAQSDCGILAKGDESATPVDYALLYYGSAGFGFAFNNGVAGPSVGSIATIGAWTHVVAWYDSTNGSWNLRINDTTSYSTVVGTGLVQKATPLELGRVPSSTPFGYFSGVIDEVGFWKRKLAAADITALYNGGSGLPFSSFTS